MQKYKHLNLNQRFQIEMGLKNNVPIKKIAEDIGVHESTVYREIKRATYTHTRELSGHILIEETRYAPELSHQYYRAHLLAKGPGLKIGADVNQAIFIEEMIIEQKYSPEAVVGFLTNNEHDFSNPIKSKTTIYSYIRKKVFLHLTSEHLPCRPKKRSYNKVRIVKSATKGTSIDMRPPEVELREEFGHWELDSVVGKSRDKTSLLVLTERKTRNEIIIKTNGRTCDETSRKLDELEIAFGEHFSKIFKTITVDNGAEFSSCEKLEASILRESEKRTKFYYCKPYSSWERGSNEVNNRFIRRFIPKGISMDKISNDIVKHIENYMNSYPRKIFGYRTSKELYDEQIALVYST